MKIAFLITFLLLLTNSVFNQDIPKLILTPNGVKPIVVYVSDTMSASDIYKSALLWVQESYIDPEEVLKADIENEKIRINGHKKTAWWFKNLYAKTYYDMDYSVEVSFKDGRYRFNYVIGQFYLTGGGSVPFGYQDLFKKNGEVRKMYVNSIPCIEEVMNNLSKSFYNYVTGLTQKNDNDW